MAASAIARSFADPSSPNRMHSATVSSMASRSSATSTIRPTSEAPRAASDWRLIVWPRGPVPEMSGCRANRIAGSGRSASGTS